MKKTEMYAEIRSKIGRGMSGLFLCSFLGIIFSSCTPKTTATFRLPGEWEPQAAIWLGWEHRPEVIGYNKLLIEIIAQTNMYVPFKIVVPHDTVLQAAKESLQVKGLDLNNLEFITIPDNRYWIRDHGPTYVELANGEQKIVDFSWTLHDTEVNFVDQRIAEKEGLEMIATDLVNEGGGIESNGKGSLMLVESWARNRNPEKSLEEIESAYRKTLGVSKFIWLKRGLINDPLGLQQIAEGYYGYGVGGHIDEMARFVNPNTIVLAWVDSTDRLKHPISQLNAEVLEEAYKLLSQARDQDGRPFNIVKIPLPDPIERKMLVTENSFGMTDSTLDIKGFPENDKPKVGETVNLVAASSYNNFLITNGSILLPNYVSAGSSASKEEKIKLIFEELFPKRELRFFDCMYQNFRGGGIHCSTKQQPL